MENVTGPPDRIVKKGCGKKEHSEENKHGLGRRGKSREEVLLAEDVQIVSPS